MKKLVAIAIAAIAAVAIFIYVGRSAEPPVAPASKPEQPQTPTLEPKDAGTQRESTEHESLPPIATQPTAEKQQRDTCDELSERMQKRVQLAQDSEPKNPQWAYPMEQKLREFFAQRFQAAQIEVTGIDCRTSFCDIRAQGFAPDTSAAFNDAISAAGLEPWSTFGGNSISHTEESGKTLHFSRMTRPVFNTKRHVDPDEDEQALIACNDLQSKLSERERAAKEAEPRDSSWADPTEQLLRQYLVEQTAKHPIKHIEITCKTSYCEIQATGLTMEAYRAFQKAAQEAASEPWSDLRTGAGGGMTFGEDAYWKQTYTVIRRDLP